MKKYIFAFIFVISGFFACFAGDSACLVDGGFSSDGKYYLFSEYGKTDSTFQGYAECFIVDVSKNDYVENGFFVTKPSVLTKNRTGRAVYDELIEKNKSFIEKYNFTSSKPDKILYIREDENKSGTDEIVFKDFVSSIGLTQGEYYIKLLSDVSGSKDKAVSSFKIMIEKRNASGNVEARLQAGNPDIKRKGVTNYKIERIICDNSGTNLVFLIEKTVNDKTGTNIRYMIETCCLGSDFTNGVDKTENKTVLPVISPVENETFTDLSEAK